MNEGDSLSTRVVIWAEFPPLGSRLQEEEARLLELLNLQDANSLRNLSGLSPDEIGLDADCLEESLERTGLGRVVRVLRKQVKKSERTSRHKLEQSVDALELSVRSANCLEKAGIRTIGQLVTSDYPEYLFRLKNMGRKSVAEIRERVAEFGLTSDSLSDPDPRLAADSLCVAALLTLSEAEFAPNTIARLNSAGISRLDDLLTRGRGSLSYWAGFDELEYLELEAHLDRLGLALETILPSWLRIHFDDVRDAFEDDIERFVAEFGESVALDGRVVGSATNAAPIRLPLDLSEELEAHFKPSAKPRNREIVRRLLGWDGGKGATLEETGGEFGLTRERIRQIFGKSLRPVTADCSSWLVKAAEFVTVAVPALAETVEAGLVESGIARETIRVEAIEKTTAHFGVPVPWTVEIAGSKRVVVWREAHRLADETRATLQTVLAEARRRVSHYGTTCKEHVLAGLQHEGFCGDLPSFYWTLLENPIVWLDEVREWFWLPTKRNVLLSRLAKILRVAPLIPLDLARKGVLRDRRMEGTELPDEVFRSLCAALSWCRVEGDLLAAAEVPDEGGEDEADSAEETVVAILRQLGPVMRRRDLWRTANGNGVEKVSFERVLSGSNVIVKHGPEIYGLIGSSQVEPPVDIARTQIESTPERPEETDVPDVTWPETGTNQLCLFEKCDPGSPVFHEQVLRCIHVRSARLRSAGTWSLMELGLADSDFQVLRSWAASGWLEAGFALRRTFSFGLTLYSGLEALALTFLASCCEVARNRSSEGELWPKVEAELGGALKRELFAAPANPKPRVRDATESVCSKLGMRHAFGREGENSWLRSVFLQFGITRSGWQRLPLWMSGAKLPVPIDALLSLTSGLHSDSFSRFWQTLQKIKWNGTSDTKYRADLVQSGWVNASEVDGLMLALAKRDDVLIGPGAAGADHSRVPDHLVDRPRLFWRDEGPRFELRINERCSLLTGPRYVLVAGTQRRIPLTRTDEGYALETPTGGIDIELKEAVVTVDLQSRQLSCLTEPIVVDLAPASFDFIFYNSAGHALPNGEEKPGTAINYLLLCRSACDVTVEPPEAFVRRVFQGEWVVRFYRGAFPSAFEIRKDGLVLWAAAASQDPAPALRQRPGAVCAGGRWGERVAVTVEAPDGMTPRYLLWGDMRVALDPAANGSFRGTITLSPDIDDQRVSTRLECEWNGRLRRIPTDFQMGTLTGVAVESEQGWKVFREGADVDVEFLRTHKILTLLPSHYDGDPVGRDGWVWMEGDHFCGRPGSSSTKGSTIGGSLYGVGQSLRLTVGPYNRPPGGQELARSVIHSGVIRRVERDRDIHQLQLRRVFQLGSGHAIWVWNEGESEPRKVPRSDWMQEDDVCLIDLGGEAPPIALAVSFEGVWLGARTCQPGWARFAAVISSSPDWRTTALWLRWWRVPLLHGSLKAATGARILERRIETVGAWISNEELPGGALFSEEHEDAWRSVIRDFLWKWRPEGAESVEILKAFGLITGDPDADVEHAWETNDVLLGIHPLLLAQAAKRGLAALVHGQDREDLAYWLGKLRNRVLGLDTFVFGDQVAVALKTAQRLAAESMAVDEFFVSRRLVPDAVAIITGQPVNDHNLRIAIANSQAARKYLAAALIDKMIRGELR